jgi:hypothetical protein
MCGWRSSPLLCCGVRTLTSLGRLPPRAKLPVAVTVVAWQYGRCAEPRLKSAEPVERTFALSR